MGTRLGILPGVWLGGWLVVSSNVLPSGVLAVGSPNGFVQDLAAGGARGLAGGLAKGLARGLA